MDGKGRALEKKNRLLHVNDEGMRIGIYSIFVFVKINWWSDLVY